MSEANGFTPTHKRILALLGDGKPHTLKELHGCLWDEMSEEATVRFHLTGLRKKLRLSGEDVVCQMIEGTGYYSHVRLLPSPYRG